MHVVVVQPGPLCRQINEPGPVLFQVPLPGRQFVLQPDEPLFLLPDSGFNSNGILVQHLSGGGKPFPFFAEFHATGLQEADILRKALPLSREFGHAAVGILPPLLLDLHRGPQVIYFLLISSTFPFPDREFRPDCRQRRLRTGQTGSRGFFALAAVLKPPLQGILFLLQGAEGIPGHGKLVFPEVVLDIPVVLGPPGLSGQGRELAFDLPENVLQTEDILLGGLQFADRSFLSRPVLGDASGLLDELPSFLGFGLHKRGDAVLFHNRVGPGADAGAQEQLAYVEKAAGQSVDGILALAAPQEPPGDRKFRAVRIGIGESNPFRRQVHGDLRHTHRFRLLGTVEDDILHFRPPEAFHALLAHHPTDGIHHVALPAAIGTHDGADSRRKIEDDLVPE